MTSAFIPVSMPDLSDLETRYAAEAVASTWISSSGVFLDRFEQEFAEASATRFALGTTSGTTALHLALAALGLGQGDEVIVPSMTYIATANAVRYCGAEPVFVDIDPATWCLDPSAIEAAITPKTKGIIPVHLLGHPADMDPIMKLALTHGLWVVEDAAEATFARYKGRLCGSLGTVGTFSFFGNKILTSGEGGAVTCNDEAVRHRMALLRGQGMDPQKRYHFPIVGYNYRMTNVAAAILCGQMERRESILARRKAILSLYAEELADVPGIAIRQDAEWAESAPWLFSCLIDPPTFGCRRDDLADELKARGIDSRPMFIPIHRLPPYRQSARKRQAVLPVTDRLGALGIMLPTYPQLSDAEVLRICSSVREIGQAHLGRRVAAQMHRLTPTQPAAQPRKAA